LPGAEYQVTQPVANNLPSASSVADVPVIPDPHEVQYCQDAVAGPQNQVQREEDAQGWAET